MDTTDTTDTTDTPLPGLDDTNVALHLTANPRPLLTDERLLTATKPQLVQTLAAIARHLRSSDERDVLDAARRVLRRHGHSDAVSITVGVSEWDDGYFYDGIRHVRDVHGADLDLPARTIEAIRDALDRPLTVLSYNGPRLGRFSRLEIDLTDDVLRT